MQIGPVDIMKVKKIDILYTTRILGEVEWGEKMIAMTKETYTIIFVESLKSSIRIYNYINYFGIIIKKDEKIIF